MEPIKTLVFLDLETSGLPRGFNPSRITEIALVAASREHIIEKHLGVSKENNTVDLFLPRVLNKLNFAVYPCKLIQPAASEVSGLTNEDLASQRPFDESLFEIINNFLERLEQPVCIIAHNGNRFDFPILQSELSKLNKALPDHVFCADSLPGFREVLKEEKGCGNQDILDVIKPLKDTPSFDLCDSIPKCDWANNDFNTELVKAVDVVERIVDVQTNFNVVELERKINKELENIRKINEKTPRRGRKPQTISNQSTSSKRQVENINNVKRNLGKKEPQRKFNLGALYKSLMKKDIVNAHRAEVDALALLECLTAVGRPILDWLDSNKVPFRSVKKIW